MHHLLKGVSLLLVCFQLEAQSKPEEYNGFMQKVDVSSYRKGKFRLKAFVKAEKADETSYARVWARIDSKTEGFMMDDMRDRPIIDSVWREYVIEGDIMEKAEVLAFGGLYFGAGKYFFDDFSLEVKNKGGNWNSLPIVNGDFENPELFYGWRQLFRPVEFKSSNSTKVVNRGSQSLAVDATGRSIVLYGHNKNAGKSLSANNITIYYEEYGVGEPLILLHGNGQSIVDFRNQIPEFAKHFHVIALDSRGQGKTTQDGSQLTYELMAKDVNDLLDLLKLEKVNVVGWSDGGIIGLILAMKYPGKVNALATMGASLYNDSTSVDQNVNKYFTEQIKTLGKSKSKNQFAIALFQLMLDEPNIKPDDLKSIKCPVLIMAGSKDVIKEPHTRLIAKSISNSKLVIFENATHYAPQENAEIFNKTTIDFLRKK